MPIITVKGMIPLRKDILRKLADGMKLAAASVEALQIEPEMVNVYFPADMLGDQAGNEIVVIVDGLFDRPERTPKVRELLAQKIKKELVKFCDHQLPDWRLIEVFVKKFDDQKDGFAQAIRPTPVRT